MYFLLSLFISAFRSYCIVLCVLSLFVMVLYLFRYFVIYVSRYFAMSVFRSSFVYLFLPPVPSFFLHSLCWFRLCFLYAFIYLLRY